MHTTLIRAAAFSSLLVACEPAVTCVEISASVADSNTGGCDPCALEEVSLDACATNSCARPLRVRTGKDGCLAQYTVYDEGGEVIATPHCNNGFGRQILDGNTCERAPWTPPSEGSYTLEVVYTVDGEDHSQATYGFEVIAP